MQETRPIPRLDEPTYTVGEFAAVVGVTPVTVRRWIKRGLVTYGTTPTGRIKIPHSAVAETMTIHSPVGSQGAFTPSELHSNNTATSSIPAPVPAVLGSQAPSDPHAEVAA